MRIVEWDVCGMRAVYTLCIVGCNIFLLMQLEEKILYEGVKSEFFRSVHAYMWGDYWTWRRRGNAF
jgi:hypothetical protein